MLPSSEQKYIYDVAFSYAGEDRKYVEEVVCFIRKAGIKVYYDKHDIVDGWGKDLYTHLAEIYQSKARFCVIFISKHYASKILTSHERKAAQARALKDKAVYVLPARFDDTELPGLLPTISYIDLNTYSPDRFGALLVDKININEYTHAPRESTHDRYSHLKKIIVDYTEDMLICIISPIVALCIILVILKLTMSWALATLLAFAYALYSIQMIVNIIRKYLFRNLAFGLLSIMFIISPFLIGTYGLIVLVARA